MTVEYLRSHQLRQLKLEQLLLLYGASFQNEGYKLLGERVGAVNGDWQSLVPANQKLY